MMYMTLYGSAIDRFTEALVNAWVSLYERSPAETISGPRGHFKNTYELLKIRALKISMLYENRIFQCTFEIPHKISLPYIERCIFYSQVKM